MKTPVQQARTIKLSFTASWKIFRGNFFSMKKLGILFMHFGAQ